MIHRGNVGRVLGAVAVVAGILWPLATSAQSTDPLVVGTVISLTGRDAAFGQEALAGQNIALEEINSEGGIGGRPLVLQVYDDRSNPLLAAEGVRSLVRDHHPVAIIGSNTSMVTSAAAVAAQSVGVPLIVPEATNPAITSIGDWIFRVCFVDPDMAGALAAYAYEDLGLRRVAILTEEKHDYTLSLTRYFRERFTAMGGEIVHQGTYRAGTADFTSPIREITQARADAILVAGFFQEAGAVVAEARRQGLNVAFLGGDAWESNGLFEVAGEAITDRSRIFIATHFCADAHRAKVRGFVAAFREQYGRRPNTSSALAYDALCTLAGVLEETTDHSAAGVKAALLKAHHEGATGPIIVDETRNPRKKVVILQARPDRRFAYVKAMSPAASVAAEATQQ